MASDDWLFDYCPAKDLFLYELHWIMRVILIILAIFAIYKQFKQQKEKPSPRLLYIFTMSFYSTIIYYSLSLPIMAVLFCRELNNDTRSDIFMVTVILSVQLNWFFLFIVLFFR